MVRSTLLCAALSLSLVGVSTGCRKQAAPTRPTPAAKRAPPGPSGGLTPGPDPAGPKQTGSSADQGADGTGQLGYLGGPNGRVARIMPLPPRIGYSHVRSLS